MPPRSVRDFAPDEWADRSAWQRVRLAWLAQHGMTALDLFRFELAARKSGR